MASRIDTWRWLPLLALLFTGAGPADDTFIPLDERIDRLTSTLIQELGQTEAVDGALYLSRSRIAVRGCGAYPYSEPGTEPTAAARQLVSDLVEGLRTGLQCLSGLGPAGRLHSYHEYQAHRLLAVFEDTADKTFQCVEDDMFAAAVATGPRGFSFQDPLFTQLKEVPHPGVVLDTFRLGGILSLRHDDRTYRDFFHLADDQIFEHRNGQPLRPANLHRYLDRPALLFHEVVHWLGHEHSAQYPDLTHLYETCCFGGSDYIADATLNRRYQQRACAILQDDDLWHHGHHRYRQMRVWHHKDYNRLKIDMRADYAR
jgi:hypothetical protein